MSEFVINKLRGSWLPISAMFLCATLYLIWPTVHTIALRKLLIFFAACIGLLLWYRSEDRYAIIKSPWLIYLSLLLVWVVFHAGFISQNGNEAWSELEGQWLWPYLAVLAGIGLALAGRSINSDKFVSYLFIVMAAQPILFIFDGIHRSLEQGHLASDFFVGMLGTDLKTSLTFSSDMLAALSCAKILKSYTSNGKHIPNYIWWLIIVLAYFVAVFASSTNSILLITACVILMLAMLSFRLKIQRLVGYIFTVLIAIFLLSYAASLNQTVASKWHRMISNTKIALEVDTYPNWINDKIYGLPKNEMGEQLNHSFYMRIAWAVMGPRVVLENPLGYGVTRKAFERLVQKKHPEASIANAHNSYINLASSVGIPGLILFVLVIVAVFRQLNNSNSALAQPAMWMIGIYVAHWATDALERDHFFELYLFVIAVLLTMTMKKTSDKSNA